jgi:hypothetical protein
MTKLEAGTLITLKKSTNPYCPLDRRYKVLSIDEEKAIVHICYGGSGYTTGIDNVNKVFQARPKVEFVFR